MADFQQKRKIKKIIYSKISLIVLLLMIGFLAHATYGIYQKERLSAAGYDSVKQDYDDLKAREDMLHSEIARLQTSEGVEADIRDKFSVAKPGEQIVVIVDKESSSTEEKKGSESFWQKFVGWFQ